MDLLLSHRFPWNNRSCLIFSGKKVSEKFDSDINTCEYYFSLPRIFGQLSIVIQLAMLGTAIQILVDFAVLILHRLLPGDVEAMVFVPIVHGIDGFIAARILELRGRSKVIVAGGRCNGAIGLRWASRACDR